MKKEKNWFHVSSNHNSSLQNYKGYETKDITLIHPEDNKEQQMVTANQLVIQRSLSVRIQKWPTRTPDCWHPREMRVEGNKHLLGLYLLCYFI